MLTIAITGAIACGKSLVGRYMQELGVPVCEADELARAVLARGGEGHAGVVKAFGAGILRSDGEIDRAALGRIVFSDTRRRADLEALTHPAIMRRIRRWVSEQGPGAGCAAAVIPLLHEIQDEERWDRVVCVAAPEAAQLGRLRERGLSVEEARARISAQLPQGVKMERSDVVLFNGGDEALLKEQTVRMVRSIRGDAT